MNPLYLTVTGAPAAAIALTFAIPALVRRGRIGALATLPVASLHRLELPAGGVVLQLAGPLGTIGMGALSFELAIYAAAASPDDGPGAMPLLMAGLLSLW